MLASVYSQRVMVKSVSSCCVRGRRVLSNPVTYVTCHKLLYILLKALPQVCMENTAQGGVLRDKYSTRRS